MHKRLPVLGGHAPPIDDVLRFLSQSEGGDWLACGLRAYARWVLGLRDGDESPKQQVGSMGHAILADRVTARFRGVRIDPLAAVEAEAHRRRWRDDWMDGLTQAANSADAVAHEVGLDRVHLVPNMWTDEGPRPLAESRLRAPWNKVMWAFRDGEEMSPMWSDLMWCTAVRERFAGIEGQPDLVCLPDGPGGVVSIDDYKFRQRPDLGGAADAPTGALVPPDRQGAWYLTILRAIGLHAPSGFQFRQINAYAGRWLSVDDFMAPGTSLVTEHGLPTRSLERLADGGGMCTADVWAEAHRLLSERRLDRRFAEWAGRGRKGKYPERHTAREEADARRFIDELRAWRPVVVKPTRADPLVCREVVRDVVVGVEGPLSLAMRGVTPARHLQTFASSPCMRRWGCPVASPCQSSLGTGGAVDAMLRAAQDSQEAREAAAEVEAAYA